MNKPLRNKVDSRPVDQNISESGAVLTEVIFEIFRVYSRLNTSGDRLSGKFGLSSARWRVLSAVSTDPKTVSQIARERGLTRQSVQQVASSLVRDDLARFVDNERHKSARLLTPTEAGRQALVVLKRRQVAWVNEIGKSTTPKEVRTTLGLLKRLTAWFDAEPNA